MEGAVEAAVPNPSTEPSACADRVSRPTQLGFRERVAALPPLGVGLGFRRPLAPVFARSSSSIACLEVVAEHFFSPRVRSRPLVFGRRPVLVHSLGLSLGTPEPLDTPYLDRLGRLAGALNAVLISDHLALTRTAERNLGHLNPVPPTHANLSRIAAKIRDITHRLNVLFLLENITTHLRLAGDFDFAAFYTGICERADCGMLLDVTNLYVNCRNFGQEPLDVLNRLDLARVVQLHVVGFIERNGRLYDTHTANIQEPLYDLVAEILSRAPVRAIVLERDGCYPRPDVLLGELARLDALFAAAQAEP